MPSARAMTRAASASSSTSSGGTFTRLTVLRKSLTPRGELQRALPPVGIVWLGPAV